MTYLWLALITLPILYAIGAPLRNPVRYFVPDFRQGASAKRKQLREEKANFILALRELDFDYEMGKLSKEDYVAIRDKYQAMAVKTMKALDEMDQAWKEMQTNLEQEMRTKSTGSSRFCGACGNTSVGTALFCGSCGTKLAA